LVKKKDQLLSKKNSSSSQKKGNWGGVCLVAEGKEEGARGCNYQKGGGGVEGGGGRGRGERSKNIVHVRGSARGGEKS